MKTLAATVALLFGSAAAANETGSKQFGPVAIAWAISAADSRAPASSTEVRASAIGGHGAWLLGFSVRALQLESVPEPGRVASGSQVRAVAAPGVRLEIARTRRFELFAEAGVEALAVISGDGRHKETQFRLQTEGSLGVRAWLGPATATVFRAGERWVHTASAFASVGILEAF